MAGFGFAQTPAFDVASVKVNHASEMGGEGRFKSNLRTEPGSVEMRNMSLKSCVQWAYQVKDYQVAGPDWIDSARFDINAKAGEPVKEEELRKMMQTLLAQRFKLVSHRETKELPVYILTVAKDGVKMQRSEGEGESSFGPAKGAGKLALVAKHATISEFADLLSSPLQREVVDQTGLTEKYDFTIDLSRYLTPEAGRKEGEGGGIERATVENAVAMGLREQLGLQLSPKKAPIDMIVVDKAEKVPTEN
jgi:uncharacterized protein (TIGR03435 family)